MSRDKHREISFLPMPHKINLLKNMKYTESQTNQNSNKFGKRPKIKKNPNFRNFDHVRSSQNGYNEENNP